jgi:hypothetical protein
MFRTIKITAAVLVAAAVTASTAMAHLKPVDPLAISVLKGHGWSASRIYDWTQGACSYQVKPASCYLTPAEARLASQSLAESMRGATTAAVTPTVSVRESGGFDWGDAVVGAGVTAGILLLVGATFTLHRRRGVPALLTMAFLPMLLVVMLGRGGGDETARATTASKVSAPAAPSAGKFSAEFIGVTNQYAREHGSVARAGHAHCVQAAPGRYMCAYAVTRNGRSTCHLMQARWTPAAASTITITLAGTTARCATLREAIHTLD